MATKINIVVVGVPWPRCDADRFGAGYFLRSLIVSLSAAFAKTWVIFATGATTTVASIIVVMLLPHSEKSGTKSRDT